MESEAEAVVRQALREISENVTSLPTTANHPNKLGTKKNQSVDVVSGIVDNGVSVCGDNINNTENIIVLEGENLKTNKEYDINSQQIHLNNSLDTTQNKPEITSSSDNNCNATILPDIINVQPNLNIQTTGAGCDDSLILSLALNLERLNIATPKGKRNLTIPNSLNCDVHSGVSSDDEVFSECQAFNETNTMDSKINETIHWDNIVSSVTMGCVDSLENTLEHIEPVGNDLGQLTVQTESAHSTTATDSQQINNNDCALINSINDSNLNNSDNEAMKADTTCILNQTQNLLNTSQTINTEETDSPEHVEISGLNASNGIISTSNEISNEICIPEMKIENLNISFNIPTQSDCLNQTYNPEEVLTKTEPNPSPNKFDNTFAVSSVEPLNETVNISGKKQSNDAILAANNAILDGTFDAGGNQSGEMKLEEEKLFETEQNIAIRDQTVSEPMDIDEDVGEIGNEMNNTQLISKLQSPMKTSPNNPNEFFDDCVANKRQSPMKMSPNNPNEFFEDFVANKLEVTFKTPALLPPSLQNKRRSHDKMEPTDDDFKTNGLLLNPSDFEFLLSKGNDNVTVERNSLLLRFDPLLGHSVPVNQQQEAKQDIIFPINNTTIISSHFEGRLSPALEEDDSQPVAVIENLHDQFAFDCNDCSKESLNTTVPISSDLSSFNSNCSQDNNISVNEIKHQQPASPNFHENQKLLKDRINQNQPEDKKGNVKMSVDVIQDMKIESDVKSIENIKTKTDEKQNYKMAELEKKIKNETLKTEDVEKKLKDAEQREEALLKRITEKDKSTSKMSGVLEAYEKAIAELIAEKEQINQNYEKQLNEIKSERDLNYQHLNSLEVTFSDLHEKYEHSKKKTALLKASEESLLSEKKHNLENLRLQELRYDKMKHHAMQQLEIANNKLESLEKNHATELTKLKALLKKEEISRLSVSEQLQQKSRENEELVKICDELINGQGS